jgi:hypothetical protein
MSESGQEPRKRLHEMTKGERFSHDVGEILRRRVDKAYPIFTASRVIEIGPETVQIAFPSLMMWMLPRYMDKMEDAVNEVLGRKVRLVVTSDEDPNSLVPDNSPAPILPGSEKRNIPVESQDIE